MTTFAYHSTYYLFYDILPQANVYALVLSFNMLTSTTVF